ncbi:hypothetical protein AB5N19_13865 [Seiridium cardinale]
MRAAQIPIAFVALISCALALPSLGHGSPAELQAGDRAGLVGDKALPSHTVAESFVYADNTEDGATHTIHFRDEQPAHHATNTTASLEEQLAEAQRLRKELEDLQLRIEILDCWDGHKNDGWGNWDCDGINIWRTTLYPDTNNPFTCWQIADAQARQKLADLEWDPRTNVFHAVTERNTCIHGFSAVGRDHQG